ncbi:hypothetical protein FACS189445_1890 [Spirochaetia bacterium]|nr:hypothetical protein FACS189445_1890 [Spirochaetia bacterium]
MNRMVKGLLFCMMGLFSVRGLFAQVKDSLSMLPFTGGSASDGDYIVSELARQRELRAAFSDKVTLVTKTNSNFLAYEQKFQRSGLTDADSYFELGKQLNASFVMAGYITKLSDKNLVIVSILDVESLQQIAGVYREYKQIEDIDAVIPEMAKKLAQSARRDTSTRDGLSVPPFDVANGVNAQDAQTLAQILACDLANGNRYAVLPRTDGLEKVRAEQERARTGETDQERVKRLGAGRNARYVLAGSVIMAGEGAVKKFAADVLDIKEFIFVDGYSERYTALADGIGLMPKLAANINGVGSPTIAIEPGKSGGVVPDPEPMLKAPSSDFSTGRKIGAGFLNLALGTGSFTMGDWSGGLTLLAGHAVGWTLIGIELGALKYEDPLAGWLGPIGAGVVGISVAYGFIRPFLYRKSTRATLVDVLDRVHIAIIPNTAGIKAIGLSYSYHY